MRLNQLGPMLSKIAALFYGHKCSWYIFAILDTIEFINTYLIVHKKTRMITSQNTKIINLDIIIIQRRTEKFSWDAHWPWEYVQNNLKKGPQGTQNLSSLKSYKIQNPLAPIPDIYTPATFRNSFLIKFQMAKP